MKQHYCFLKKFNNYFNRKIIMFSSLEDYENASEDFFIPVDSNSGMLPFDFNPNDNVTTEIIANDIPFDPDYFLLLDGEENIVQRWFVLEQKRNRKGQWLYSLKRDVIADNFNAVRYAPAYVERAILSEDDSFIVNDEGMNFNEVKIDETSLKDNSGSAWLVGYLAKSAGGADINVQVPAEDIKGAYVTLGQIASDLGTSEGVLANLLNLDGTESNPAYWTDKIIINYNDRFHGINAPYTNTRKLYEASFAPDFSSGTGYLKYTLYGDSDYLCSTTLGKSDIEDFIQAVIDNRTALNTQILTILTKSYMLTTAQLNRLNAYIGKTVKYAGKYYSLGVKNKGYVDNTKYGIAVDDYTSLQSIRSSYATYAGIQGNGSLISSIASRDVKTYIMLDYLASSDTVPELKTSIASGRNPTGDQEYDIIAIPLNVDVTVNHVFSFSTEELYARKIISAIALEQNANVYDIQLLPYCPVQNYIYQWRTLEIGDLTVSEDYDFITKNVTNTSLLSEGSDYITFTDQGTYIEGTITFTMSIPVGATPVIERVLVEADDAEEPYIYDVSYNVVGNDITVTFKFDTSHQATPPVTSYVSVWYHAVGNNIATNCGIMFYVQRANFDLVINHTFGNDLEQRYSKKVISNCFKWRLNSPNYQGAFDFNVAKNGGVSSFNVFCTYKPYTPFIKVAPNFGFLYGAEFGDNRGLICGGDFSLPRTDSAWQSYQLNNKNYQNIFNREIQNLDFMQRIERRNAGVGAFATGLSDTAKSAGAGFYLGGPVGSAVGGAIGGIASGIGGAIDYDTVVRTQKETRQLAIDKFNLELGNIKALPNTLTKVGSFDAISKIFPFVEFYSCTDEELEAFQNKIEYESMLVMRIGNLDSHLTIRQGLKYFKAHLIRCDDIAEDYHMVSAIYEELLKGVYI